MRGFLAFALWLALLTATAEARTVTIIRDIGGTLNEHHKRAIAHWNAGNKIRFDGQCMSACTVYLMLPPDRLCATKDAEMWFHAPPTDDKRLRATGIHWMMTNYPAWVRRWIENRGGLTSEWLVMPASYIRMHLKGCD